MQVARPKRLHRQTRRSVHLRRAALRHVLTNTAYIERWPHNVRDSHTGEVRAASEWVEILTPRVIDDATFEAVRRSSSPTILG